ncbi:MAG: hypothetical protein EOO75_19465 [Myxococcales bacterium]|nr:MAG: hypothetical protein EOO75_19465 [Myxococcales bacterium]
MRLLGRLAAIGWAMAAWSCRPQATQAQLRAAAAHDLNCPDDNLRYRTLDDRRRWVAGCGKSATYEASCERRDGDDQERCGWRQLPDDGVER